MKGCHHQAAFERATVRLEIDPDLANIRTAEDTLLFRAISEGGDAVTVAIGASAWSTLLSENPRSAIAELEQLALTGGWERSRAGQVWRVILI